MAELIDPNDAGGYISVKVIPFAGTRNEWYAWKEKFLARAAYKGYRELLVGETEIRIPLSEETTDEAKRLRKLNFSAYNDLILSMDCKQPAGRVAFNTVRRGKTAEYPSGHARTSWRHLCAKFEPKNTPNRARLHRNFYNATCKQTEDPGVYITYMDDLRERLHEAGGQEITDDEFMVHILNSLPDSYLGVVEALEDRIGDETDPLTLEQLEEKLLLKYERITKRNRHARMNHDTGEAEETVLVTVGGNNAKFNENCNFCGKHGHRWKQCHTLEAEKKKDPNFKVSKTGHRVTAQGSSTTSKLVCSYCHKEGHLVDRCFKKQRDQRQQENQAFCMLEDVVLATIDLENLIDMTTQDYEEDLDATIFPSPIAAANDGQQKEEVSDNFKDSTSGQGPATEKQRRRQRPEDGTDERPDSMENEVDGGIEVLHISKKCETEANGIISGRLQDDKVSVDTNPALLTRLLEELDEFGLVSSDWDTKSTHDNGRHL